MKKPLNIIIIPGIISGLIPVVLGVILWTVSYITIPTADWAVTQSSPFAAWLNQQLPSHSFMSHFLGFIFSLLIGAVLVQYNERFSFIRTRTMLPLFFFIVLMGSNINAHEFSFGQVGCLFLLFALWQLFSIYQQRSPVRQTFNIGFFLAVGAFFTVEMLFFLPLFWLGMIRLNSFTLRSFLSSLLGFLSPFLIFTGIAYLQSDVSSYFDLLINQFHYEFNLFDHEFIFLLYIGTIAVGAFLSIVNLLNNAFNEKIRVSRMLGFISMCFVFSLLLYLMMSNKSAIVFTLSSIFASFLYAHYYSLHYNLFIRILFWVQMSISLIFYLSSLFFN